MSAFISTRPLPFSHPNSYLDPSLSQRNPIPHQLPSHYRHRHRHRHRHRPPQPPRPIIPPISSSAPAPAPPNSPTSSSSPLSTANPPQSSLTLQIISLALPALGALALDPLLSLIDTAFVGRLGPSAIAGVGLATILLNISFSLFNFLCVSITPMVANSLAKQNPSQTPSQVISTALHLALILGLINTTFLTALSTPLCLFLGATPQSLPPALHYLHARAIAAPFALMSLVLNGALRGFSDLRTPFLVAFVANLLNILLDLILIFHFHLGVAGAAYATSFSQIFAVLIMLTLMFQSRRLQLKHLFHTPSFHDLRPMLTAGLILTIRTVSILTTIAFATATAATQGVIPLAAYELTRQLWLFKATVLDSLAAAAQALVASAMARGRLLFARKVANRTIVLSTLFGGVLGVGAVLVGTGLPRLFTDSEAVVELATRCIRVAAVCAPLNGFVFALDAVLSACADYRYLAGGIAAACLVACGAMWGVRLMGGGVVMVWGALNVLMVGRAAVVAYRYVGGGGPIPAGGGVAVGVEGRDVNGFGRCEGGE